ncbi:DASH complex subunit Spc19 [Durotheca rogersii]|uniref:DASH complex subunit Spc19 n=1 Tax=Durotheca rogersii TaxID=419775 RepID=UPI002220CEC6|nr:DASH complex subunit Spc19 [Durotheca rogersii]KAI5867550.1 DASH complex subunit Spc19 [Durotheca rogersii]
MASSTSTASYADCVAALRTSLSYLESSVSTLGAGVADFPRLGHVLKSVRHYELIPQPALARAEASLRDEIGPAIAALLDRADAHVARAERRVEALRARAELQQGRLDGGGGGGDASGQKKKAAARQQQPRGAPHPHRLAGEAAFRARAVRQRREALRYGVERLELEVLQKERELRKRLETTTAAAAGGT